MSFRVKVEFRGSSESHRVTPSPPSHPISEGQLRGEWGDPGLP